MAVPVPGQVALSEPLSDSWNLLRWVREPGPGQVTSAVRTDGHPETGRRVDRASWPPVLRPLPVPPRPPLVTEVY